MIMWRYRAKMSESKTAEETQKSICSCLSSQVAHAIQARSSDWTYNSVRHSCVLVDTSQLDIRSPLLNMQLMPSLLQLYIGAGVSYRLCILPSDVTLKFQLLRILSLP